MSPKIPAFFYIPCYFDIFLRVVNLTSPLVCYIPPFFKVVADEFSHTVLHRQPFVVPGKKAAPGRPVKPVAGKYRHTFILTILVLCTMH